MTPVVVLLPLLGGALLWPLGVRVPPERRPALLGGAAVAVLGVTAAAAIVAAVGSAGSSLAWATGLEVVLSAAGVAGTVAVLVALVATVVVAYASVHEDRDGLPRLLGLLVVFVGAMELLVLAGDLLTLTAAWELVAVVSWALIGSAWNRRETVALAAHAFNATRAGSVGLVLAAGAVFAATGSVRYEAIGDVPRPLVDVAAAGVLAAAASKSAQLPFSPWLFSAMAGPTSVSALLHSATMVAAGAYALVRLGEPLAAAPWFRPAVVLVGLATALVGGVVASAEVHGKRILAASTAAQYGLMFVAVGAGAPGAAAAHLVAHALFKAQLFLAVGVGLDATGTGDVRRWRLGTALPRVAAAAAVGALALGAVPPLGGAWTKEQIVAAAVTTGPALGVLTFAAGVLSTVYAARLHLLAFGRGDDRTDVHRPHRVEVAAVAALAVGSVVLGLLWLPQARGVVERLAGSAVEVGKLWETAVALALVVLGAAVAVRAVRRGGDLLPAPVLRASASWFGVTPAAGALVVRPVLALAAGAGRFDEVVLDAPARALGALGGRLSRTLPRFDDLVVDGVVRGVVAAARGGSRLVARVVEGGVDGVVRAVAAATTRAGDLSRTADDAGVDGAVERVADAVGVAGARVRALQTGLAHHYYVLAVVGLLVVLGAAALWR